MNLVGNQRRSEPAPERKARAKLFFAPRLRFLPEMAEMISQK
jgi:hypothetical protein